MPVGSGGMFDRAKEAAERVRGLVGEHRDKADDAIEKTGDFLDDKTRGKYTEHVDKAKDLAHGAVDKLAGEGDTGGGGRT
jgi:uncharacterized protein YjbJ (UPF0337 family)